MSVRIVHPLYACRTCTIVLHYSLQHGSSQQLSLFVDGRQCFGWTVLVVTISRLLALDDSTYYQLMFFVIGLRTCLDESSGLSRLLDNNSIVSSSIHAQKIHSDNYVDTVMYISACTLHDIIQCQHTLPQTPSYASSPTYYSFASASGNMHMDEKYVQSSCLLSS